MVKFFLILLLVLVVKDVVAQPFNPQPVRFGLRAGANFSHIDFSRGSLKPPISINTNWQPGIVSGFVVVLPIVKNFYFQPEYLFSQMGGKIENENSQYLINYISLPVLFKRQFLNRFYFLVGPQFDLLINASEKTENNTVSIEKDIEQRSLILTGGLEFFFTNNAAVAIRYMHGINHIGLSRETGEQDFKYEGLQFSILYLFSGSIHFCSKNFKGMYKLNKLTFLFFALI